ncbi:MAG: hypothetical protein ACREK8_01385 [Gemmatimonadales bacterium]
MGRFSFTILAILIAGTACHSSAAPGDYLFLWAGDSAGKASDFLAVIDANPGSPHYGVALASIPVGMAGTHPHHTEAMMPADDHLLANGFHAGRSWLFDLSQPQKPRILTAFGDLAGFSHPHTYVRLANGNVLATFQYRADSGAMATEARHDGMSMGGNHTTGGLVEMDERGQVIRSASASDTTVSDRRIYPYSVLAIPAIDRAVSTSTDMDQADSTATSQWVQFWRLSDLTLLKTIALEPGPRGDENRYTGEPRLLPDSKSVYIHTFDCGLYLVRDIDTEKPTSALVKTFDGKNCGVPILTGHYWLQTVPETHSLVAVDIADPEHPRDVSTVSFGADEAPHWIAIDATGRRVVLNSAGSRGDRLFIVNLDPATGALSLDNRFRDPGSNRAGISLRGKRWPHGFSGVAAPHGTVFSR